MIAIRPLLSICIATRNRADVIGPTLDALLAQCTDEVEVVVVDGASTDATPMVVGERATRNAALRYFPQQSNSGIDGDFDKAVALARGEYCWLLSDDDIPLEGAVACVVEACRKNPAAVISDAEVYLEDMTTLVQARRMSFRDDRTYGPDEQDRLLADCGDTLSFIGALAIRRDLWLGRDRASYYGTEFVHVGVVFQAPLPASVIAIGHRAVLRIRYGVGNWVWRSFNVWMFKWPRLIWSFEHIPAWARERVTPRHPWRDPVTLLIYRAKGWYRFEDFRKLVWPVRGAALGKILPALIALLPGPLVFLAVRLPMQFRPSRYAVSWPELNRSPYAPRQWLKWLVG